ENRRHDPGGNDPRWLREHDPVSILVARTRANLVVSLNGPTFTVGPFVFEAMPPWEAWGQMGGTLLSARSISSKCGTQFSSSASFQPVNGSHRLKTCMVLLKQDQGVLPHSPALLSLEKRIAHVSSSD